MESLLTILNKTTDFFSKYGIENPKLDAELLIAHVLNCNRMQLYLDFERPLDTDVLDQLRPLVKRRATREPLQYILGTESFMDFELKVDQRALIPRPETEELIELIFNENTSFSPHTIIDLGTGTGAIACALARHYKESQVIATDISKETLNLTQENIKLLSLENRIQIVESNWFDKISGTFDLIISNPPYLSDNELSEIEPEVAKHEPVRALSSGPTGLEAIHVLLENAERYLTEPGKMYLEVGADQKFEIENIGKMFDGIEVRVLQDLNRKDRFVRVTRVI